jgi:UDP-N-acetylmuramate dehydrogenase
MNQVLNDHQWNLFVSKLGDDISGAPVYPVEGGRKLSAGWLIEYCGFPRGTSYKGVGLSSKHALALVNRGGSSADVLEFSMQIQKVVLERSGVLLQPEIVFL